MNIRSRGVERDYQSILNQLVNSMAKDVLLRTYNSTSRSKPPKKSVSNPNPASRENYISRVQGKSFSRARIVHPGTRQCPGSMCQSGGMAHNPSRHPGTRQCPRSQEPSSPYRTTCPRSRIQSDQESPGSRETSHTDWNLMMRSPEARLWTRGPSPRRTHLHRRLHPILLFRRLRFIPCCGMDTARAGPGNASGPGQRQVYLR